jgi:hypothetical protein
MCRMLSVEYDASFKYEELTALLIECLNHSFYNCKLKLEFSSGSEFFKFKASINIYFSYILLVV